jgi:disulfide bond formation protein DsbB
MTVADLQTRLTARPRLWPAAAFAASLAMLAGAWGFQYIGGLQPCALCLYQRWPYWVAMGIGLAGVLLARRLGARGMAALAGAGALTFLAGAAIAGFHVGVEQHWWEGLAACGGAGGLNDPGLSLAELRARLLATPVVRCDEVPWSLFGISLAGYNFVASLALAGASGWAARNLWRNPA